MKEKFIKQYQYIDKYMSHSNCKVKCLYDVLKMCEINITIDQAYFLIMNDLTYFKTFDYPLKHTKVKLGLLCNFTDGCEFEALKSIGLTITELDNNQTDSLEKLKLLVDKDSIVLYCLNSAEMLNKKETNTLAARPVSVYAVIGYDENKIILNYRSNKGIFEKVDYEKFELSRKSIMYPVSPNSKAYAIRMENTEEKYTKIEKLIIENLNKVSGGYFIVDKPDCSNITKWESSPYFSMIEHLNSFKTNILNITRDEDVIDKLFKMQLSVQRFALHLGSEGTLSRREFGEALKHINIGLNKNELCALGDEFNDISTRWRNLSRDLYHYNLGKLDSDKCIEEISLKLKNIWLEEDLLLKKLYLISGRHPSEMSLK
ncbi:MAG: hypothetical protein ACREV6_02445 [Clostridium sp.]|uniref:hypothetical protein n=1 Tax=Clostridium sp. TaxID=1506 RepID=UPI003D6D1965